MFSYHFSNCALLGLVQYAAMMCCTFDKIQEACRIGKLAMSVLNRMSFVTDQVSRLYFMYYGFVAIYCEPVQSCADNLRRGFECGMAIGDTSSGESDTRCWD